MEKSIVQGETLAEINEQEQAQTDIKKQEEALDGIKNLTEAAFAGKTQDIRSYSPLTLAYIGDGVYELVVRTKLVQQGNCQPNKLHQRASKLVKASAQSAMAHVLMDELTEEECSVYRRGRNAKSGTMAKHATMGDYRRATGVEALIGYLYLQGEMNRILELMQIGLEKIGE